MQVSLEMTPVAGHHAMSWYSGFVDTCHAAIYLSCHLPDTVDELEEDRRAIRVCVILISMANPLKQSRTKNKSHGVSWGNCWGHRSVTPQSPQPLPRALRRLK